MAKQKRNDKQENKVKDTILYVILLSFYLISIGVVRVVARSQGVIALKGYDIPISAFTGVLSSLANICVIFMVVFLKKKGFITALILLILQFPILLQSIVMQHATGSMPGIFTNVLTIIAIFLIYQRNREVEKYQETELNELRERQIFSQRLFEQTATALVNAIDAKDTYSHGHSTRVAMYARKIAKEMGKSEEECYKIYFTGLLHDVGKIGIPLAIINKKGKLTEEEYAYIKQHPILGNQILSGISEYPYLSIGALYHHERYDGKGYPMGLKGEDIPEIARIISVADAYDAMSSYRSYRSVIPQMLIREEIVKGSGTQFDPEIAKVMQHLIDLDEEFEMKEKATVRELAGSTEMICKERRGVISDGILVTPFLKRIHLRYEKDIDEADRGPEVILFDSMDGRYHNEEDTIRDLNYYEYCEVWFDGYVTGHGARKIQTKATDKHDISDGKNEKEKKTRVYDMEAVKQKDHVQLKIDDGSRIVEVTIALPDCSRYVYLGLTGENCSISDVSIEKDKEPVQAGYITRIADMISYLDGDEGDVPSIQVDGFRTEASKGIPVKDDMTLTFHTKSLPSARLVWHCPYIVLFTAQNGKVNGPDYHEYALIRLDGESWECEAGATNRLSVNKDDDFIGWENWKRVNKEGYDCAVHLARKDNIITVTTENHGIGIKNETTFHRKMDEEMGVIYVALSGDQVAVTGIRVK